MIVVPGQAGDIGVLARHAPLIATLKAGSTRVYVDWDADDVREFATGPGFFQVQNDRAIALVDDAVLASEVDDARARRQLEEAQAELERVDSGDSTADRWQLEQRIRHAENQLTVSGRSWGVLIQKQVRGEEAYRGERFKDHPRDVAGDPDLLNLTRPEVVLGIHRDYFAAGADIATTNTFTATSIGQADYGLEPYVYEL